MPKGKPAIYASALKNASIGGTADTFEELGSFELRSDATMVLGILVEAALATSTAAEAIHGQIRLTSGDLGRGASIASIPPYDGGHPATNISFRAAMTKFIPYVNKAKGKEKILAEISSHVPDPTGALSVVASVVYVAGGEIPAGHDALRLFPRMAPIASAFDSEAAQTVTATGETAITALDIPAWAREIVGFEQYMVPDLMTAGEEVVGFIRYRSSMPDFEPQEWPYGYAISAPLGTPVGIGVQIPDMPVWGTLFPTSGRNETITPYNLLNVGITTGHGVGVTVYYR